MLENARRICDAKFGILMLREADGFRSVAIDGAPPAYTEAMRKNPHIPPRPGSGLVVLVETKKPVQIANVQTEPGYMSNRLTMLAGARTLLIVPLLKDGAVIGAINILSARSAELYRAADCAPAEFCRSRRSHRHRGTRGCSTNWRQIRCSNILGDLGRVTGNQLRHLASLSRCFRLCAGKRHAAWRGDIRTLYRF